MWLILGTSLGEELGLDDWLGDSLGEGVDTNLLDSKVPQMEREFMAPPLTSLTVTF